MPYFLDENSLAAKKRGLAYNDPDLTKNFGSKYASRAHIAASRCSD